MGAAFEGELRLRAPENVNPKRETGEVELRASACTVLAVAKTPPFPVNEDTEVDEQLRLRHRYLDLRRVSLQRNLRAAREILAPSSAAPWRDRVPRDRDPDDDPGDA